MLLIGMTTGDGGKGCLGQFLPVFSRSVFMSVYSAGISGVLN